MTDKLGPYIKKLMLVVIDRDQDDDVKQLAWDELTRLKINISEFLDENEQSQFDRDIKKEKQKQLLQEDKENVSDK
jgi:hypothetical protein